ncbi:MAG: hypothetical protein M3N29_07265 [Chloroflexota bacterium]|nr:hypothetical protein [Chloroflexota bacterium]
MTIGLAVGLTVAVAAAVAVGVAAVVGLSTGLAVGLPVGVAVDPGIVAVGEPAGPTHEAISSTAPSTAAVRIEAA